MPLPAAFNLIAVTGKYLNIRGEPMSGEITFIPSGVTKDLAAKTIIMPAEFTATLDSNGSFSIQLPASDDPDITGTPFTYAVHEKFGSQQKYNIQVPVNSPAGTLDMSTAIPVTTAPPVNSYVTIQELNNRLAALTKTLVLASAAPIPVGTQTGTVIVRTD